jgi:hypothetical protein
VVIDVAEKKEAALPELAIVPAEKAPSSSSKFQLAESTELPRIMADRKLSFQKNFDDKTSRISEDSRRSKNSKASRNTARTNDSKNPKYIQTCSWMFRDETDGFAIRLPDGVKDQVSQRYLNLSDIAKDTQGPFADEEEVASARSRGNGAGSLSHARIESHSEAGLSLGAGSETTGSRTAASTAATNLMTNQGLKDLFRMIWSARGFRRKYSRECPF